MHLLCKVIRGALVDHRSPHEVKTRTNLFLVEEPQEEKVAVKKDEPAVSEAEIQAILKQAALEAGKIKEKAQAEAQKIQARAQEQAEILQKKVREEAHQAGYQEGYQAALAAAEQEAARLRAEAREVVFEAHRLHQEIIGNSEKDIVMLAVRVAEKIIHHQLQVEPETVLYLTREACRSLTGCQNILIFVNPAEVEILRDSKELLTEDFHHQANISIIADADIPAGGCRVDTESGQVEVTLEGQLAELKRILLSKIADNVGNGGQVTVN